MTFIILKPEEVFFVSKSKTFEAFATICTTFVLQKRLQHPYKENVCFITNMDVSSACEETFQQ